MLEETPISLRERVGKLLTRAIAAAGEHHSLTSLRDRLLECRRRLDQPMRAAIVGLIKAGKSTLMNALLGEEIVATGSVETTFNLNWLHWSPQRELTVHFKDGRPPEKAAFEHLAELTKRSTGRRETLLAIRHLEVGYPNPMLESLNLIDTPGLASSHRDDAQNTRDFLQLHGDRLTRETEAAASEADAVLYLFSQGIGATDDAIMGEFRGPAMGRATPVNSLGVLTKVDQYWSDPNVACPMSAGQKIAGRLAADAKVGNLFYGIHPVCGLLAFGAQTLTPGEFGALERLAGLPVTRLEKLVRDANRVVKPYPDEPAIPSPEERAAVLRRLGQYGIALACRLLRAGTAGRETLGRELLVRSGFPELRDLILRHFGNRAFLIKLGSMLPQIESACFHEERQTGARHHGARAAVRQIASDFDTLRGQEHAFRELDALRAHYESALEFSAGEVRQLLEVTGEFGTSCAERLGMDPLTPVPDLVRVAQERAAVWRSRANDDFGAGRRTIEAARVLSHSFERLAWRSRKALELLTA
jgi:hypothetical protein